MIINTCYSVEATGMLLHIMLHNWLQKIKVICAFTDNFNFVVFQSTVQQLNTPSFCFYFILMWLSFLSIYSLIYNIYALHTHLK